MDEQIKKRLTRRSVWLRLLYMVIFAIALAVVEFLVWILVIAQFLIVLFSGRANERLLQFGNNISAYAWQLLRFQTFNTETQPFPFSDWPDEEVAETPWTEDPAASETLSDEPAEDDKPGD